MKEYFVLVPHGKTEAGTLSGWVLNDESRVESLALSLQEIAAQKPDRVTLVVPVTALSWHLTTVPAGMRKNDVRLLPVLQSMLEDVLVDEADNAHIGLAPGATSGSAALAMVCDRTWLKGWVNAFTAANIRIARIAPEVDPSMCEAMEQGAVCTAHGYTSYATFADGDGLSTFPLPEGAMFVPAKSPVFASAAAHTEAAQAFGSERVKLLSEIHYLELLKASAWDLAQHDLAATGINRIKKQVSLATQSFLGSKQWLPARIACVSLAMVYGLGNAFLLYQSNQALESKKATINTAVTEAFPRLTVIVDPVLQVQRELATLQRLHGVQGATDFLPLVTVAGSAWGGKNAPPKTLDYSDHALLLTGLNDKSATAFIAQVQAKGYDAIQRDNGVRVTGSK